MNLFVSESAEEDINDLQDFYESFRTGMGTEFLLELNDVLDQIESFPGSFAKRNNLFRVAVMQRFKVLVFYDTDDQEITINQVVHTKRNPGSWRKKS